MEEMYSLYITATLHCIFPELFSNKPEEGFRQLLLTGNLLSTSSKSASRISMTSQKKGVASISDTLSSLGA